MLKLTKYRMIKGHHRLWSWLAKTGCPSKEHYPDFDDIRLLQSQCFPCQYCIETAGDWDECEWCPLDWASGVHCGSPISLWMRWINASTSDYRKMIAIQIRDTPLVPYPNRSLAWCNRRFNV